MILPILYNKFDKLDPLLQVLILIRLLKVILPVLALYEKLIISLIIEANVGVTLDCDDALDGFVFPVGEVTVFVDLESTLLLGIFEGATMEFEEVVLLLNWDLKNITVFYIISYLSHGNAAN